ncbi:MAG: uracil-DNA glycosylase, partial [Chitinophagales bacterium]|nr:uracil-DNA glycosylase [Chitinophagales bacterium]
HGCLQSWTTQGVFLLNAILTVEANKPASHQKRGWEEFTNAAIQQLSLQREGLIFMLWGNFAQQKAALIDERKHTILKAPHPSPFSAHTGFLGCGHFSKANAILTARGESPVNWQV